MCGLPESSTTYQLPMGRRKHSTGSEQTGSVTDGPRVFFTEGSGDNGLIPALAQVSSEGGESMPLPNSFGASVILDISPNASELLVMSFSDDPDTNHALWAMPVLGGSPRRLGNVKSLFAAWSPDGKKLVFAEGFDLFLANYDGSNPYKLVTVPGIPGWVASYIPGWATLVARCQAHSPQPLGRRGRRSAYRNHRGSDRPLSSVRRFRSR